MREPSSCPSIGSKVPALVVIGLCAALPAPAWAYVDPNAGGLLYQILFPLLVAIGAAWAGLRHRIGYWWSRLRGREPEAEAAQATAHAAPGPDTAAEPGARPARPVAPPHD